MLKKTCVTIVLSSLLLLTVSSPALAGSATAGITASGVTAEVGLHDGAWSFQDFVAWVGRYLSESSFPYLGATRGDSPQADDPKVPGPSEPGVISPMGGPDGDPDG